MDSKNSFPVVTSAAPLLSNLSLSRNIDSSTIDIQAYCLTTNYVNHKTVDSAGGARMANYGLAVPHAND
jgi:hypothetical protein